MASSRLCAIPECGKAAEKRGWCNGHYIRWRRHGDPLAGRPSNTRREGGVCQVEGCQEFSSRRAFCNAHYLKLLRRGNPLAGKTRPRGRLSRRAWLDKHAVFFADPAQCLIFPYGCSSNKYGMATLEDGDLTGAHRYVCEAAHGPPPTPEHETAHSCGRKPCVNRWHLRWATAEENAADRLLHGTDGRGEKNGRAKLARSQVDEIIRLRGVETGRSLASRFRVTPAQISHIQLGKQWTYGT